jgi:hypothetical protein
VLEASRQFETLVLELRPRMSGERIGAGDLIADFGGGHRHAASSSKGSPRKSASRFASLAISTRI